MKRYTKLFLCFLLTCLICKSPAQTTDIDAAQVPKAVTANFTKEFPGITPAWKTENKIYKAFFTDPKTNMMQLIVYDDKGNVQRRESELDKLSYPENISQYHSKNFPGEDYKLWKVQDKTGVGTYYSERNRQIIWFDKNGNYVIPKESNVQKK